GAFEVKWPGGLGGLQRLGTGMRLDNAGGQNAHLAVRRPEVVMVNPVAEAVLVAKELRRRSDRQVKRTAALINVDGRLHAHFGQRFADRLGILKASFVLDFEDHRWTRVLLELAINVVHTDLARPG